MMNKLNNLDAGFVLGRYELVLRIASGGMGEVWAARLKGTRGFQKVVALKFLLPELSANPHFEQMFLDEAALAAQIRHPNVVQVVDLGEENEILYQVMEWVSGESLWAIMRAAAKKDGIPLEVAARIICQVCAGLHAAHELKDDEGNLIGLVHRDVTPQNILLTADGLAKVVDFGVAKFAGRAAAATQVGEIKGKVPYMAPEHIKGRDLDRRADVFSLGILFYQLLAGVHPFLGDTDQLTMVRISSATPAVPLRARMPSISEALSHVVATALEKSPDKRTKTALDLMHDIERAVPGASMASSNDLVAEFLRGIVGDHIEAREAELREALKHLDMRSSLPPEGGRWSQIPPPPNPVAAEVPSAPGKPPAAEVAADVPPSATPSGLTGPVLPSMEAPADEEPQPPWIRRHSRAVVAAAAIGVVSVIILAASGGPPPPSAGAGETAPSPSPSAAPEPQPSPSATPEPPPPEKPASGDPPAKVAEPSPTSASSASAAPVAAVNRAPTNPTPRPIAPVVPSGSGKVGPKKPEFTPGGL